MPWLVELYKCPAHSLVVRKSAQIGVTEWLTAKAFYLSHLGMSGLYVMPTERIMFTFVANRINRSILTSPYYRDMIKSAAGSDSGVLKHILQGALKFVGSNSDASFIEYPADYVINDERDRCDQVNIEMAYDRLKSSFGDRDVYKIDVSTPTLPDYGIDEEYKKSDQQEWMVPCPACGEWQTIDFFRNVAEESGGKVTLLDREWTIESGRDIFLFCRECGSPWDDRFSLIPTGRWEKQHPDSRRTGFFPHRLLDPKTPLAQLWTNPEKKGFADAEGDASKLMVCYNSDLGLPYRPEGAGLSEDVLNACKEADYLMPESLMSNRVITAGVDVGKRYLHVRISVHEDGKRKAVFIGKVLDFSDLGDLFDKYSVKAAAIDLNPETRKVRELQAKIPFLYATQFVRSDISKGHETKIDQVTQTVSIDRTMICDRLASVYATKKCVLPSNAHTLDSGKYYKEMTCPIRVEQEGRGERYYIWTERNSGRDDYFFAEIYDLVAEIVAPYLMPVVVAPSFEGEGMQKASVWNLTVG